MEKRKTDYALGADIQDFVPVLVCKVLRGESNIRAFNYLYIHMDSISEY